MSVSKQDVLLVEDNRGDAILAKLEMQKMGYDVSNVDHALDLDQAKTFLSLKTYDVVFLDYMLGADLGTDLIPFVDTSKTNIVILSGFSDLEDIRAQFSDSVLATTQKPLRQEKLEAWAMELEIEREVKKKVKKVCVATWSMVCTATVAVFGLLTQYSDTLKVMVKAGIDHLMNGPT